jgi:hypothetical protein
MRKLVLSAILALVLAVVSCSPRMFGAAMMAAAIIGTVAVLSTHDGHFHDEYCGHHRRYHEGHWVYYYDGHWEYYDHHHRNWYFYNEY